MAVETEVENLVVRLQGEGGGFLSTLAELEKRLESANDTIEQAVQENMKRQNRLFQEAAAVVQAVATPMEAYRETQGRLADLVQAGALSQEHYNRALEQARQALPDVQAKQAALRADQEQAKRVTDQTATAQENYSKKMGELKRMLDAGHISMSTYTRGYMQLRSTLPEVIAQEQREARAMEELNQQRVRGGEVMRMLETRSESYSRRLSELNQLHRVGALSNNQHTRAVNALDSEYAKLAPTLEKTAQRLTSVGQAMSFKITAPLAAMGAMSVKQFSSFDGALTTSMAIMDNVTEKHRDMMAETAKAISSKSVTDPTEIAKGYYYLASAGYDAEASLRAVSIVEKFSVAGAFDMERATEQLADAQNALGLKTDDTTESLRQMTRIGDVLVDAANASNASVVQLSEALTNKAATAMRGMNMELEEGVSILSIYANQGKKGAEAGTLMDIMLRELNKSANENAEDWKRMGMSVYDSNGKMRKIADVISQLEGKLKGLSDQQKYNTMMQLGFRSESMMAIRPLLEQSDALRTMEERYKNVGGTMERVASKQMGGFGNTTAATWNQIKILSIEIGQKLVPIIRDAAQVVNDLIGSFRQLDPGTQTMIVKAALLTAALGPVLSIVGKLTGAVSGMLGVLVTVGTKLAVAGGAVGTVTTSMALLTVGVLALKVALVALAAVAATWIVNAITGQTRFNAELTRSAELTKKLQDLQNKQTDVGLKSFDNIADPRDRLATISAAWRTAQKEQKIIQEQMKKSQAAYQAQLGDTGSNAYKEASAKYDDDQARFEAMTKRVNSYAAAYSDAAKAVETLQKSESEQKKMADEAKANASSVLTKAQLEEQEKAAQSAAQMLSGLATPAEKFAAEVQRLDEYMGRGLVTTEQYNAAYENLQKQLDESDKVKQFTSDLEMQAATWGMNSRAVQIYKLGLEGATAEQLNAARAADEQLTALEKKKKLEEQSQKLLEKYKTPTQKFEQAQSELNELYKQGLIPLETYQAEMAEARKELEKETKVKIKVDGIDAVGAGLDALVRLDQYREGLAKKDEAAANLAKNTPPADVQNARDAIAFQRDVDAANAKAGQAVAGNGAGGKEDKQMAKQTELLGELVANTRPKPGAQTVVLSAANFR